MYIFAFYLFFFQLFFCNYILRSTKDVLSVISLSLSSNDQCPRLTYALIQGVSEIGALILTGNRTHKKEQLSL
jgi:hypothetical protein